MLKNKILIAVISTVAIAAWIFLFFRFSTLRLFTLLLPSVFIINIAKSKRLRNIFISVFVICWLSLFHYESLRYYENATVKIKFIPEFTLKMPKTKFLFPPIGWIMFYQVSDQSGNIEVYGFKGDQSQHIDPHDIFRTRTIMFDNIHRGILGAATRRRMAQPFCRFLKYRFPYFDKFVVIYAHYPNIVENQFKRNEYVQYQCVY